MKVTGPLALACVLTLIAVPAFAQPQRARKGDLRSPSQLTTGSTAPDFKLKTLDGKSEVQLSNFRGQRPVLLVFGSYT